MKELNKILYDILLKIDISKFGNDKFVLNEKLLFKYFNEINIPNSDNLSKIVKYFESFFNFCFELSTDIMIEKLKNFKI